MASSESGYSGSSGSKFRLHLDVTLLFQEESNNRSRVRLNAYLYNNASTSVWNSDPTPASYGYDGSSQGTSINGYGFGGSSYGAGNSWNFALANLDVWINHNSDGTKTAGFSASHDAQNSPYLTTASTSLNMALPTINRFASFSSITVSNVTDTAFNVNVTVSPTCDQLYYRIDGGSYILAHSGSFTSRTINFTNMQSSKTFTLQLRVRRQDSGLFTESGSFTATTDNQNRFFDLGDW